LADVLANSTTELPVFTLRWLVANECGKAANRTGWAWPPLPESKRRRRTQAGTIRARRAGHGDEASWASSKARIATEIHDHHAQ